VRIAASERNGASLNTLCIFLGLPRSLEKSAHMLLLKHVVASGSSATVLTLNDQPSLERVENWFGVRIVRLQPRAWRWKLLRNLHGGRMLRHTDQTSTIRLLQRWSAMAGSRLASAATWLLSFPDRDASAVRQLTRYARQLHEQAPFDAVVSLYHPLSSHIAARKFTQQTSVPWVGLTKDYYSWPDNLLSSRSSRLVNRIKRSCEAWIMREARAFAAVNSNIADYIHKLAGQTPVTTLPHCFDDDLMMQAQGESVPSPVFRLVSVGLVAETERPGLNVFFEAVGGLLKRGLIDPQRFRVRFVGHGGRTVRECAARSDCVEILEQVPPVPHADAMRELVNATCLLFQQAPWGNRRRLPEYMATRRPILAFPDYPGVMSAELLREYGAARIAPNRTVLQDILLEWWQEFLVTGRLKSCVNSEAVDKHSAHRRAEELLALLEGATARNRASEPGDRAPVRRRSSQEQPA
jgi:hypothetical protein